MSITWLFFICLNGEQIEEDVENETLVIGDKTANTNTNSSALQEISTLPKLTPPQGHMYCAGKTLKWIESVKKNLIT